MIYVIHIYHNIPIYKDKKRKKKSKDMIWLVQAPFGCIVLTIKKKTKNKINIVWQNLYNFSRFLKVVNSTMR